MGESEKVYLKGHITVPEHRLDEVRAALPTHITLTRAEPGCISFNVDEDPSVSGRFTVAEVYENQAAFDAHQKRAKASTWFKVTEGIPRDYQVSVGRAL